MASSLRDETMGIIMRPMTIPALRALNMRRSGIIFWSRGVTKLRGEIAVDDGGYSGEYFEGGLNHAADFIGGVFGEEDCRGKADGDGYG